MKITKNSVLLIFLVITNAAGVYAQTVRQTAGITERAMSMSGDFAFAVLATLMIRRPARSSPTQTSKKSLI